MEEYCFEVGLDDFDTSDARPRICDLGEQLREKTCGVTGQDLEPVIGGCCLGDFGQALNYFGGLAEVPSGQDVHPIHATHHRDQLATSALRFDRAFVDDGYPVTEPLGLLHVVGGV